MQTATIQLILYAYTAQWRYKKYRTDNALEKKKKWNLFVNISLEWCFFFFFCISFLSTNKISFFFLGEAVILHFKSDVLIIKCQTRSVKNYYYYYHYYYFSMVRFGKIKISYITRVRHLPRLVSQRASLVIFFFGSWTLKRLGYFIILLLLL